MNEEFIEKQLKLSKRQNKDERYDYLCSEFNAINYCIDLEKYTNKLQQENQKLKKQLEVGEEQYNDLVEEKEKLQEQLSGNTLQLEEYKHKGLYNTCLPYSTGYKKAIKEKENQQKEFIEYMTNTIEDCNNYSKYIEKKTKELHGRSCGKTYIANEIMKNEVAKKILKEILSKYKEIIGVSDEKK